MRLPNEVIEIMNRLDASTYNHSYRMWEIAAQIEAHFQMEDDYLSMAAFLHDIGKVYISEKILDKRSGLSKLERDLIDLHPYIGYQLLEACSLPEEVKQLVLYHHGLLPKALGHISDVYSEEVSNKARILHTLDVFEALTTDRPYKRRMSVEKACEYMERESGYDREVLLYLKENIADF